MLERLYQYLGRYELPYRDDPLLENEPDRKYSDMDEMRGDFKKSLKILGLNELLDSIDI